MKIEKLVVGRSMWWRGKGQVSALRMADGRMCCLGFLGHACGIKDLDLDGEPTPAESTRTMDVITDFGLAERWPSGVLTTGQFNRFVDSSWTNDAVVINDSEDYDEATRERLLIEHFYKIGIELSFVD